MGAANSAVLFVALVTVETRVTVLSVGVGVGMAILRCFGFVSTMMHDLGRICARDCQTLVTNTGDDLADLSHQVLFASRKCPA